MNSVEALGSFVSHLTAASLAPAQRDDLALHVFDSIGAALSGAAVAETIDVREIVEAFYGAGPALAIGTRVRSSLPAAAMLGAVAARCSEVDDIHLRACVTPGSLVVPTAMAVASMQPRVDGATFLAACAAGAEVLVRFGLAVDGPKILYRDLWPTYLCAPFAVAATVARLLDLDRHQTTDALAIAATLAVGTTGRPPGKTSRWLVLGCAVQNGVLAALAAQRGMRGDSALLGTKWSAITGVALEGAALAAGLGERFESESACLKPWCAAKQTIAAAEAFGGLLDDEHLVPSELGAIAVAVPAAYRAMIDRPALPASRQESFASIQYQLALAAFAPDARYDVARERFARGPQIERLIARTHVVADARLDGYYPDAWPARVTVTGTDGTRYEREVIHPAGDPGTSFGWEEVRRKYERAGGVPAAAIGAIADGCRSLSDAVDLRGLIALVERAAAGEDAG